VASTTKSKEVSDSNCKAYENESSTSSVPVEISPVKPASTELIERPKSDNPPIKKGYTRQSLGRIKFRDN
jgi:hypothetical protein